jgi:hypothetical protein
VMMLKNLRCPTRMGWVFRNTLWITFYDCHP